MRMSEQCPAEEGDMAYYSGSPEESCRSRGNTHLCACTLHNTLLAEQTKSQPAGSHGGSSNRMYRLSEVIMLILTQIRGTCKGYIKCTFDHRRKGNDCRGKEEEGRRWEDSKDYLSIKEDPEWNPNTGEEG